MEILAQQWPLLAAFLTLQAGTMRLIWQLFERLVTKAETREAQAIEREKAAVELAKENARVLSQLSDRLEQYVLREERR